MTVQFRNSIVYNNADYDFVAKSNDIVWFDPEQYGFVPDGNRNTACRAGYVCRYKIENNCLVLDKLNIYDKFNNYHPINDVLPTTDKELKWVGDVEYRNLRILLDNVTQELLIKNGNELLSFTIENGLVTKMNDYSNVQVEIDDYCKERMTSEELKLRGVNLMSLRMDEWDKQKRDVDMLPYKYVKNHWWLFNEIKREPYGDDKTYNYYALTRRNSLIDYTKGTITTIDGDVFPIIEFTGIIEIKHKRQRVEEKHFLKTESYWQYGDVEKCELSIFDQNNYVKTSGYYLTEDEIMMFKNKFPKIKIIENHKKGERG